MDKIVLDEVIKVLEEEINQYDLSEDCEYCDGKFALAERLIKVIQDARNSN